MFGFGHAKKLGVLSCSIVVLIGLVLGVSITLPCLSYAQAAGSVGAYAAADALRNAAYSQAYPTLTPPAQGMLIRAELAWTDFSDKERALTNALQNGSLVSQELVQSHGIAVVEARTKHLREFFVGKKVDYPPQYTPQNRDQLLNTAYAECMRSMPVIDQGLLLSSERSWITYRDADIECVMASYDDPKMKDAVIITLTVPRIEQLTSIAHSISQVPVANASVLESPLPLQNSSANPDDLKAVIEFQGKAKACLSAFVAKKNDPFFTKPEAIKNVPELSSDLSNQISKLDAQYAALPRKPDPSQLFEPAVNESAAVELLTSWSKFTQQLKAGSLDEAGDTIQIAINQEPKDVTADYLPLWQAVESWREVYLHDKAKFYDHVQKAQSLAELGKSSAAIKEYQAAYDLVEDSTIPEKIKNLREQSLGL